jgi:hypothetical protein
MPRTARAALLVILGFTPLLFGRPDPIPEPMIIVGSLPPGLVQESNLPGGTSRFTLVNVGGESSTITLRSSGNLMTVSPMSATIKAGESQEFSILGLAQPPGLYESTITVEGPGVPFPTRIPVRLFSANRPSDPPRPRPTVRRLDIVTPEGAGGFPRGTLRLTNEGPGTVRGLFYSDVPWIVPDAEFFEFPPFGSGEISFSLDPSRRPPGTSESGSLTLEYLLSPLGKNGDVKPHNSTGTSKTTVTVVSTLTPPSVTGPIPNLGGGEVALFAPGVGRVQGSVGLFISDLTLTSRVPNVNTRNVSLYYTPASGETRRTTFGEVSTTLAAPLGDLVKGVFGVDGQIGSLQVRAPSIDALGVAASIFNSSDPAGTFGTAIPVFRSDRAAGPAQSILLAGLQKTATSHTNLFVQETSGNETTVSIRYLDANGVETGSQSVVLGRFAVILIQDPLTTGSVTATLNHAGGNGRFVAYATPIDRLSGDFWAVADWSSTLAYDPSNPVVLPVAGAALGANQTDFRTDVTIANAGNAPAEGTLHYYAGGVEHARAIALAAGETKTWENLTRTLFDIEGTSIGYHTFTPASGEFRVTSRNYNYVAKTGASYGTAVPAMALDQALGIGERVRFGGLSDASAGTVAERTPATFRTNVGIAEVAGSPVTVRATLNYSIPSSLVTQIGSASAVFEVEPRQLMFLNRISQAVLGDFRGAFGDLRNLQLDLEVLAGEGRIVAFTSTIDNGTGDSILRID